MGISPHIKRCGFCLDFDLDTLKRLEGRRVAQEPEQQLRAQSFSIAPFSCHDGFNEPQISADQIEQKNRAVPHQEDRPLPELTL